MRIRSVVVENEPVEIAGSEHLFVGALGTLLVDGCLTFHRRAIDESTKFSDSARHGDIREYQTF